MIRYEACCAAEGVKPGKGYLFDTWKEAARWLYHHGRMAGQNWDIREVER